MKVVLMQDIKKVGRKYETVEVKDGFALNSLIPNKKALQATSDVLKKVVIWREQLQDGKTEIIANAEKVLAEISNMVLSLSPSANETGTLYESIDSNDIAELLTEKTGVDIPAEIVKLKAPIKKIGKYNIDLVAGETERSVLLVVSGPDTDIED